MNKAARAALYIGLLLAAGVGAFLLGGALRGEPELNGTELENRPAVGDITLQSASGEVRLADYAGKYLVVFFGYTNCPDVCPLTMSRLGSIYRSMGEPEEMQVVMITVDPERDGPEEIGRYAAGFHPRFVGLGGSEEALDDASERFYVGANDDGMGLVLHSTQVMLVDPDSRFWRIYNDDSQRYLEQDLRALLDIRAG